MPPVPAPRTTQPRGATHEQVQAPVSGSPQAADPHRRRGRRRRLPDRSFRGRGKAPSRGQASQALHLPVVFQEDLGPSTRCARWPKHLAAPASSLSIPRTRPTLKKHNLVCAIASSHWFDKGMNNPAYHAMCLEKMEKAIDLCISRGGLPQRDHLHRFSARTFPDDVAA